MKTRMLTFGASIATLSMVGSLALPGAAVASSKGRKNTAIGLGAAAAHQLLKGKTTNALILGAGTAYAYKQYKDKEQQEKRQRSAANYRNSRTSRARYGAAGGNLRSAQGNWVFTGRLTDDTDLVNRAITVDHSGTMRRTDVPKSAPIVHAGTRLSVHDLREGDLVRVTARKTDENRFRATRIEVLNAVDANRRSEDRVGGANNDVEVRPGSRYSGVGVVQSVSSGGRSFTIRVGNNTRTVFAQDANFEGVTNATELRAGDRVRITGTLEDRDVTASEIIMLD